MASAFAGCRLEPEVDVLSPPLLADIARRLLLDGQVVYIIDVGAGGLKLLPVGSLNVRGQSPDPATWSYECTLNGPDGSITRNVPEEGVVAIRYSTDAARPWRGVGPLARSNLDAGLLSALTTRMGRRLAHRPRLWFQVL